MINTLHGGPLRLAVVDGEGIGPSVIAAALDVLDAAIAKTGTELDIERANPLASRDDYGLTIGHSDAEWYDAMFAAGVPILHGPAGGRFVYDLRRDYELSAKLTPVIPDPELTDASVLRPDRVRDVNILIVRDNAGGLYQGTFGERDGEAFHEARYTETQVRTIMERAVTEAKARSGVLTVVTKPGGVPAISALWKRVAAEVNDGSIDIQHLEIDNACFQLVVNPAQFDVMVSPNMFGDVLGDTGSAVLGSRGLSYSANFGPNNRAVYQTAHGAAHDLTGKNVANPIAQIRTLAWLLRESLGLAEVADVIESSIRRVLSRGVRTVDIADPSSTVVGTREFGEAIAAEIGEASA